MRLVHTQAKKANRTFLKGAYDFAKWWKLRNGLSQRSDRRDKNVGNLTHTKPIRKKRVRNKN